MTADHSHDRPCLVGRGPVVRAEHHFSLPVRHGLAEAGWLSDLYRPFPPGAHVVIDVGSASVMHTHHARDIGQALAHVGQITITGTEERSTRGYVEDGLIFGIDAMANVISRFAHEFATESRK